MLTKVRSRLTYANVIATLALFIALGGGAYAALKLPKNSVGSAQIKTGAVNSSKVQNGSLLPLDFKAGQLPAGAQGPQGIPGQQGAKGDTGTVDTSNFYSKSESDGRFLAKDRLQSSGLVGMAATDPPKTLLTRGSVTIAETCTDQGGGVFETDVTVQTTESDSIAGREGEQDPLPPSTPTIVFSTSVGTAYFRSQIPLGIVTPTIAFQTLIATGVMVQGHDCVAEAVATP
jgi:hypothetical protein